MKSKAITTIIGLVLLFVFVGVRSTQARDYVEAIKSSTLSKYNYTTIGKAFDTSFSGGTWKSFETKKGVIIIEFTGKITKETHNTAIQLYDDFHNEYDAKPLSDAMIFNCIMEGHGPYTKGFESCMIEAIHKFWWPVGTKVTVQWSLTVDRKNFQMTYYGPKDVLGDFPWYFLKVIYS